ncbi:selenophosphate synthase [Desulfomonile tiedjei DSM 6799]|uniref:Selenide, water dikinase n=1 Tax=Desulfomonile tiedjei (strain ATCC 49306 / DSM 6799 / DCB-1) TaxID=706587 RepID=I4C8Q9_DESTA|nr:selenophosphate synthase [Desulfomonile tiedjei DSM 6799]
MPHDPNVLVGFSGSEDAGVYKLSDDTAIVQTLDFFTPIVDDPKIFGMVSAANSLSDIYAMGGRPITAMNVVCFPIKRLSLDTLRQILEGGLQILREAGVALVGGHSVEDDEPKYGLSVTGLIHPEKIMTNGGIQPGDRLILTKALGTGVIATALKAKLATPSSIEAMVNSMCTINKIASEVAVRFGVKGCTDITGFGLVGHLVEMARAGQARLRIRAKNVPLLEGARDAASMGLVPAGAYGNRTFFAEWTTLDPAIPTDIADLLFDPQTSGGLVMAIPEEKVAEFVAALLAEGVNVAAEIGAVERSDTLGHVEFYWE